MRGFGAQRLTAVITGMTVPGFIVSGVALLAGLAFMAFGLRAPHLLHLG